MKGFFLILFFTKSICFLGQSGTKDELTDWNSIVDSSFSISYPKTWTVDRSGENGTSFYLFSLFLSSNDIFQENVNLIIQDVKGYGITLDAYTEFSIDDIGKSIQNSRITENIRKSAHGLSYHKMVYTGEINNFKLTFMQYYWVENEKVYLLTFTAEPDQFNKYLPVADRILNSFVMK
jgi:hypothetical protein